MLGQIHTFERKVNLEHTFLSGKKNVSNLILARLPLRRPLCVDNCSALSGHFHLSHAN